MSRINAIHHEYLLGQSKLEEVANFQLQLCVCPFQSGNLTFINIFSILEVKNKSNVQQEWW